MTSVFKDDNRLIEITLFHCTNVKWRYGAPSFKEESANPEPPPGERRRY
jgi:hypothetical protein